MTTGSANGGGAAAAVGAANGAAKEEVNMEGFVDAEGVPPLKEKEGIVVEGAAPNEGVADVVTDDTFPKLNDMILGGNGGILQTVFLLTIQQQRRRPPSLHFGSSRYLKKRHDSDMSFYLYINYEH
jgi:hypothetical protein